MSEWKKISDKHIDSFKEMMRVINRFYENNESKDFLFRKDLIDSKRIRIYARKSVKGYSYLIYAENLSRKTWLSWIHIDGIQESRDMMPNNDSLKNIACMTDFYNDSKKVRKGFEERIKELKI